MSGTHQTPEFARFCSVLSALHNGRAYDTYEYMDTFRVNLRYPTGRRATYLAYAYLRGLPYRSVEPTAIPMTGYRRKLLVRNIAALVQAHGTSGHVLDMDVEEWMKAPEDEARKSLRVARENEIREAARERYALHKALRHPPKPTL